MAAPDVDLWPTDIGKQRIKTPAAILRQQASLLGKRTNNLVEAKVRPGFSALSSFMIS